jgi:hypothetical protein
MQKMRNVHFAKPTFIGEFILPLSFDIPSILSPKT